MDLCSSLLASCLSSSLIKPPQLLTSSLITNSIVPNCSGRKRRPRHVLKASAGPFSYQKFIHFALDETQRRTLLIPSPLQRVGNESGLWCLNYKGVHGNLFGLDLNPLHDVIDQRNYKEKYFKRLIPLGLRYSELFPWGGKLTSESLKFFSPIVIWTKFPPSQDRYDCLYSAFKEYYQAWLELIAQAPEEIDPSYIKSNREAQHKYLTWRAEKDPGHGILKRLIGESRAQDLVRNFLFDGLDELGSKGFLDYFPEYRREDGSVNEKRSILGKSFENRPWDARGEFIGDDIKI
uniref:Uncharacterized protein n=1 Tax=Salix viminalis TaxID=40686 RepID=A0A6N2MMU3_SALVM